MASIFLEKGGGKVTVSRENNEWCVTMVIAYTRRKAQKQCVLVNRASSSSVISCSVSFTNSSFIAEMSPDSTCLSCHNVRISEVEMNEVEDTRAQFYEET